MDNSAQEKFDREYITSTEIVKELDITRAALCNAVSRGLLPNPIKINGGQMTVFERDKVSPYVEAWKTILQVKRAITNVR